MMRIMIAAQQASIRTALRIYLQEQPGFEIVSEVKRVGELLRDAPVALPDVIFMDWGLNGFNLFPFPRHPEESPKRRLNQIRAVVISSLHHLPSSPHVVVLCNQPDDGLPALYAGADAFFYQGDSPSRLLALLRTIGERRAAFDRSPS
jgi:DNA-binding NarL/FixJ family response regulator